jgi:osmotically-inducible protein OsmY
MRLLLSFALFVMIVATPPVMAQSGVGQFFRDEALVMKVTTKLQFHKQLLREKIDVKVNQGIVSLSGYVSSPELAQLAAKLTAEVGGVAKVLNGLEVGAPPPSTGPGQGQ